MLDVVSGMLMLRPWQIPFSAVSRNATILITGWLLSLVNASAAPASAFGIPHLQLPEGIVRTFQASSSDILFPLIATFAGLVTIGSMISVSSGCTS